MRKVNIWVNIGLHLVFYGIGLQEDAHNSLLGRFMRSGYPLTIKMNDIRILCACIGRMKESCCPRKHGETSVILCLMTAEHGRHAGLVRGGAGRRARGLYEAGNFVMADWRARLEDHLGSYTCELLKSNAALVLDRP